jgi:hypothetical protein
MGFSLGIFSTSALKRRLEVELFPGALKRSFPRINAGAPTKKNAPRGFYMPEGELVWTGISDSFNPNSADKAINAVVKVVVKNLGKEGLF